MRFDSLIFDMDGTLWNATASYAEIWNRCFAEFNLQLRITADDLIPYMGKSISTIIAGITQGEVPANFDSRTFEKALSHTEDQLMPILGGVLYPGVYDGLKALSQHYRLLMLSNCGRLGLRNFMRFTATEEFFTGSVTHGENPVPKSENMRLLIERYNLANAIYVGDTQGDCDETHRAGIPFAYMKYGFGQCNDYDMAFDSFQDFTSYFLELK